METSRSVPIVLAQCQRAALNDIRATAMPRGDVDGAVDRLANALEVLEELANEILKLTAMPLTRAPHDVPPGQLQ